MKIMLVGEWTQPMYEKAIAKSMRALGHQVIEVSWRGYFANIFGRFETKYGLYGPLSLAFNYRLATVTKRENPDVVLLWRATQLRKTTLARLRKLGVKTLASYNHDDFSGPEFGAPAPSHHHRLWRLFLECAPEFDIHFVKRQSNIDHLKMLGARCATIMPMWFDPDIHKSVEFAFGERERFETDVAFVGHYEPDGREKSVCALVNAGIDFKLWGGKYWTKSVLGDSYERLEPIVAAIGEDYAKALCGAKICLAFLSKLNRDTYTRRCFEIPACGRLMLAERTLDLQSMFKEDEEACFFSSDEELLQKVRWLLAHPEQRERIAEAGRRRVWADGHDVVSRAKKMLEFI